MLRAIVFMGGLHANIIRTGVSVRPTWFRDNQRVNSDSEALDAAPVKSFEREKTMIDVKSFLVGLGALMAYGSLYFSFSLTARRPVFRRDGGDVVVAGHLR